MSFILAYGESENNDCFWYGRYAYCEFDSKGNPIESTIKYVYPDNSDCMFEIQFDYASNYQKAEFPITIYLNEENSKSGCVTKKKITDVYRELTSSVVYKDDAVEIFSPSYQVTVTSDGEVMLYKIEQGVYKHCLLFTPTDYERPIYAIRYSVLLEKLKSIKWGNP